MGHENESIGIFDSGVGGLTVFAQIAARLPEESIVYLGDTARVPYGTKSADTVVRYARNCARVLLDRGVKLVVAACNTATAYALEDLQHSLDVPVIGVIAPGAHAAAARSASGRIGVIGTAGTVASGAYADAIAAVAPHAKVFSRACPLFVPLAEEGWVDGDVPRMAAAAYLGELGEAGIDTLVLGCTHYPLLAPVIAEVLGPSVALIDSARETAATVVETIDALGLRCTRPMLPRHRFLVSDAPETFHRTAARFLGRAPQAVEWVDF